MNKLMDGRKDGMMGWMERWMDRALKVKITKEKLKNYNLEGSVTLLKVHCLQHYCMKTMQLCWWGKQDAFLVSTLFVL